MQLEFSSRELLQHWERPLLLHAVALSSLLISLHQMFDCCSDRVANP